MFPEWKQYIDKLSRSQLSGRLFLYRPIGKIWQEQSKRFHSNGGWVALLAFLYSVGCSKPTCESPEFYYSNGTSTLTKYFSKNPRNNTRLIRAFEPSFVKFLSLKDRICLKDSKAQNRIGFLIECFNWSIWEESQILVQIHTFESPSNLRPQPGAGGANATYQYPVRFYIWTCSR